MANRIWKDGTRRGIVYVEGREQAERVLAAVGRSSNELTRRLANNENGLGSAMAVYTDRKGKPFAWQVPFDLTRWDEMNSLIGT